MGFMEIRCEDGIGWNWLSFLTKCGLWC
jgi:hypothetical protein